MQLLWRKCIRLPCLSTKTTFLWRKYLEILCLSTKTVFSWRKCIELPCLSTKTAFSWRNFKRLIEQEDRIPLLCVSEAYTLCFCVASHSRGILYVTDARKASGRHLKG